MSLTAHEPEVAATALESARRETLSLVDQLDEEALSRVVSPLLSPLLWDLGHIASFERQWLLGGGHREPGSSLYDPFVQPRASRGNLPLLGWEECRAFMAEVRKLVLERIDLIDPFLIELVIQHELQHTETMLQALVMFNDYECRPRRGRIPAGDRSLRWIACGGECIIGSAGDDFAYDNERPAHSVTLEPFELASRPVTNDDYLKWVESGGYDRRDWWSEQGWVWRLEHDAQYPLHWRRTGAGEFEERVLGGHIQLEPHVPVCHVSWFEADAYARAHGARLPTEFEWEFAARRDASSCSDLIGQVWEWTSSEFAPYPGFKPFAYERYSQPFFNAGYRVLRGGSWATHARTLSPFFRNWDLPQRRQIFAGLRLARGG